MLAGFHASEPASQIALTSFPVEHAYVTIVPPSLVLLSQSEEPPSGAAGGSPEQDAPHLTCMPPDQAAEWGHLEASDEEM